MNDFKIRELCDMKSTLVTNVKAHLSNIETAETKEVGEVIDMIKDLSEAVKNEYEACYYKTVIEAMEEGKHTGSEDMYGYTPMTARGNYSMRANGRMGYKPMVDQEPYVDRYINDRRYNDMRYGYMNPETMDSALDGVKSMWDSADPEKRKRLKHDLMSMLDEID